MHRKAQFGLLINEVGNLFQKQIWRGFVDAAQKKGMLAVGIIGKSWKSPIANEALHNQLYRFIPFLGLDGHVVAESVLSTHEPFSEIEEFCGIDPTTTVYLGKGPSPLRASIAFDATQAIKTALKHLAEVHGCTKIGCVTGVPTNPDTMTRLKAWRSAMQELKLPCNESLEVNGKFTNETGGEAALLLLNRHPDLEAIFFMNDTMAVGAIQALEIAGFDPSKLKIIGMDDIAEARWLPRPLTTIRQPTEEMSRRAVERLCETNSGGFTGTETFYASLTIRETCGCHSDTTESGHDEFIREQMQVFFQARMVRGAAQELFSDLDPSTWDERFALALQQAEVPWAGVLEWKGGILPEGPLDNVEFHRWIEYRDGKPLKAAEQFQTPAEILAEKLSTRQNPCLLMPLVCESQFLGVILLEMTAAMDNFYESLLLQVSAALQGTRLMEIQKETQRELVSANQQLLNLSNRDELTSVLNRRGFMLLAEQAMLEVRREKGLAAIVFADMDKLKVINDDFGHAEGDHAIQATAASLRESLRQTDIMARIGGDEFVIFARIKQESDVRRLIHRANSAIQHHSKAFPPELKLGFSSGVAFCRPDEQLSLQELIDIADAELYREKEQRHKGA